jgi:hypothetical protein
VSNYERVKQIFSQMPFRVANFLEFKKFNKQKLIVFIEKFIISECVWKIRNDDRKHVPP